MDGYPGHGGQWDEAGYVPVLRGRVKVRLIRGSVRACRAGDSRLRPLLTDSDSGVAVRQGCSVVLENFTEVSPPSSYGEDPGTKWLLQWTMFWPLIGLDGTSEFFFSCIGSLVENNTTFRFWCRAI